MSRDTSVAIIGLGSRSLSVLERIVTMMAKAGPSAGVLNVHIIDPTCEGSGVHAAVQPDYLLLNTICANISMSPDPAIGVESCLPGKSLYQWATSRGLRLARDGHTVGARGRALAPTDYLPRRLLGEYLNWSLRCMLTRCPSHVRVTLHQAEAVDMCIEPRRELVIALSNGARVHSDFAFLTTGHAPNQDVEPTQPAKRRLIAVPYPLPARLNPVKPAQTVAVNGFGLSAIDIVSSLTVGRGGRFVNGHETCRYIRSGREPTVFMYSRTGVPCRARPLVTGLDEPYEPLVLTKSGVDALRANRRSSLELNEDLLPLLLTEMSIAYRTCQARWGRGDAEIALRRRLTDAVRQGKLAAVLADLDRELGPFDPTAALNGGSGMKLTDGKAYQTWLTDSIAADLAEGVKGYSRSPLKASLYVISQLRDVIRYAVDFGGLDGRSLDEFTSRVAPLMNRAVVGPQHERHGELLALIAAGVVQAPFGPAPTVTWRRGGRAIIKSRRLTHPYARVVDWIVSAQVPSPSVELSASPLIASLHHRGYIRRHRPPGSDVHGIDINLDQHPLDKHGRVVSRLWVLGPLCEGATFYNNALPSPTGHSRPVYDAHRCVVAMLAART